MLKITKGLKPFVNISDNLTLYVDGLGNRYVRVKMEDIDFCIAAHDYYRGSKEEFTWGDAMGSLREKGMSMFTYEQIELYKTHMDEINDKLKEIGGEIFEYRAYWTSTDKGSGSAVSYRCEYPSTYPHSSDYDITYDFSADKESKCRVRPIINL